MREDKIDKMDLLIYLMQANLAATTNLLNFHLTPFEKTEDAENTRATIKMNSVTTAMYLNDLVDKEIGPAASRRTDINLDELFEKLDIGAEDETGQPPLN